jgi:hypothetical protein
VLIGECRFKEASSRSFAKFEVCVVRCLLDCVDLSSLHNKRRHTPLIKMRLLKRCFLILISLDSVFAFTDDNVAVEATKKHPDQTWPWQLPAILNQNDTPNHPVRLTNCMPHVHPSALCHPGARRIYWDSKDTTKTPPPWANGLKAHHDALVEELEKLPKSM